MVQLAFVRLGAVICRRGEERERGGSTMQTQLIFNSIVLKMRFGQNEILERGEVKWAHCIISQTSVTLVAGSRYHPTSVTVAKYHGFGSYSKKQRQLQFCEIPILLKICSQLSDY